MRGLLTLTLTLTLTTDPYHCPSPPRMRDLTSCISDATTLRKREGQCYRCCCQICCLGFIRSEIITKRIDRIRKFNRRSRIEYGGHLMLTGQFQSPFHGFHRNF